MPSQTRQSRDSSSPILAHSRQPPSHTATSTTSTHTLASQYTPSDADTLHLFTTSLARLDSEPLQAQRYNLSPAQESVINMLALGAKIERALEKRIVSQDAEGKGKVGMGEKVAV